MGQRIVHGIFSWFVCSNFLRSKIGLPTTLRRVMKYVFDEFLEIFFVVHRPVFESGVVFWFWRLISLDSKCRLIRWFFDQRWKGEMNMRFFFWNFCLFGNWINSILNFFYLLNKIDDSLCLRIFYFRVKIVFDIIQFLILILW